MAVQYDETVQKFGDLAVVELSTVLIELVSMFKGSSGTSS